MVRILGNSPERVPIKDLGDVIYYKQLKDYTDEQFESRDLQRAVKKGLITVIERFNSSRGSSGVAAETLVINKQASPISIQDIKQAVRELLPEVQSQPQPSNGSSVTDALRQAIPMIINTVRQEISSLMSGSSAPGTPMAGDAYVPTISTGDMISNIKAEQRETSGDDVSSSLDALRKLKKSNNK